MTDNKSSLEHLEEMYVECGKKKKKCAKPPATVPKEDAEKIATLIAKIENLEALRAEQEKRFEEFVTSSNALSKKAEQAAAMRVAGLEKDVEEWKKKYADANDKNVKLNLKIGDLEEKIDEANIALEQASTNTTALKAEVATVRAEMEKMRLALLNDSRTEKDLKDAAIGAIEEARRAKQKLVNAEKASQYVKLELDANKAKTEELERELEETNNQLEDANRTNEVAFDSIKEWEDFVNQLQAQGTVSVESSLPKFTKEQITHITGLLDTKAILQSKRQKAGSLLQDFFKKMLDVAKDYGDALAAGSVEKARSTIKNGAADLKKKAEKFGLFVVAPNEKNARPEAISNAMILFSKTFTQFLTEFSDLEKKSGTRISANKIDKVVTKESCAGQPTPGDKFINEFPNNKQQAGEVVKSLAAMILQINIVASFVLAHKKDKFIDVEEQIEQRLYATFHDTIFYAVTQISRVPANITASKTKRQNLLQWSNEIGSDMYTSLTADEDRSLFEKSKISSPFKQTTVASTAFKSPFKPNLATNSSTAEKKKKFMFRAVEL